MDSEPNKESEEEEEKLSPWRRQLNIWTVKKFMESRGINT